MSTSKTIMLFAGDGIGTEIMAEAQRILARVGVQQSVTFNVREGLVGGAAIDSHGTPLSDDDLAAAKASDAILFGAVGGPRWDDQPYENRPEAGLLRLRKDLDLFANLRPALCFDALADASSLKRELIAGLDILIVRELTSGVYFGEPKRIDDLPDGSRVGIDTQRYTTAEIDRITRVAFDMARKRRGMVHSSEKSNVMKSGVMWRQDVKAIHEADYSDVKLQHILADNCAMQLVKNPKQFDVILTDNLFGDLLSDIAAMLTGSLGMLPSASLGSNGPGMYEPVHGSAPDIMGQGLANPIAMILSLAMALRYSLDMADAADQIEAATDRVLKAGIRTVDIMADGCRQVSTAGMGDAILKELG